MAMQNILILSHIASDIATMIAGRIYCQLAAKKAPFRYLYHNALDDDDADDERYA